MLAINPSVRMNASPSFWTRDGQSASPAMQPGAYFTPSFSHDGKRVALALRPPGALNQNIWVYDSATSTMTRITSSDVWEGFPILVARRSEPVFRKGRRTNRRPRPLPAGCGPAAPSRSRRISVPASFALFVVARRTDATVFPDPGTQVVCNLHVDLHAGMSIFTLALDPAQNPHPLLNSDERVGFAQFSPDGKSIVFSSNIDGSDEIYIQSYQAAQPHRWRVSTQGGTQPRWTSLGREIVYLGTDGKLESVPVKMKGNELELGNPKTLFAYPPLLGTYSAYQFDVSPNGDRFVFLSAPPGRQAPPLRIILNWESLLTQ